MSQSDADNELTPTDQIQVAIVLGELDSLKRLGDRYPEEMHREDGKLLCIAIPRKKQDVVSYLVDFGLDVNYRGDSTPLELSIDFPNLQIVEMLLKRGADPNLGCPLIGAINCKVPKLRVPFLKLLVENGADVNQLYDTNGDQTKLISALDGAKGDCRDYLLSVGAKTAEQLKREGRKFGEVYDRSGKKIWDTPPPKPIVVEAEEEPTPNQLVSSAISRGDLEAMKVLAAKYPDEIRRVNGWGNRLDAAATSGHVHIINYLLDYGLDINCPGYSTPLASSISIPSLQIAQLLLKRGADPNLGRPLIGAMNCKDKSLCVPFLKLLVEHGADVNQLFDIYGDRTNLFSALDGVEGDCRDYLLSVGAKTSEQLKKEGRKFGEVYDHSGKKIRDTPPPKPKKESDVIEDEEPAVFASDVVAYFTQEIGTPDPKSLIEIVPAGMPITVHSIPATAERPYVTLFTTGLSAAPMNVPDEMTAREQYERAELYIQLPADWKYTELKDPQWNWPMLQLRRLAKAPHLEETWLGTPVTIIPNGDPPKPLASNAPFDSLMLVPDKSFPGTLGTVIQLYRVLPLYPEERELEAKKGHAALMRALDKVNTPFVVDLNRRNAAKK